MSDLTASKYRYWAFITYSHKDRKHANWLHRAIESYGIPAKLVERGHTTPVGEPAPKRFQPIFRDRDELPASTDLNEAIEGALAASRYLIVICSPRAARAQRVNREVETFAEMARSDRVFAFVIDGEPNSGDEKECFPPALKAQEPLAADARWQGDGRNDAKLKLLAGMLGVSFDVLKQREAQRRIRRLQRVMAMALLLVLIFAGLTWYSNRQRVKAVQARQEAESMLDFLTSDLRDALVSVGRPDLIEEIEQRVGEYYGRLGADTNRYQALHEQSVAAIAAGNAALSRGDLDLASTQFQASLVIAQRMVALDAANSEGQGDLALSHDRLGVLLGKQGKLEQALAEHRAGLAVFERLAQANTADLNVQHSLANSRSSICLLLWEQGNLQEAFFECQASLDIARRLALAEPGDTSFQFTLSLSRLYLGSMLFAQGYLAEALAEYRASLAIAQQLVAADASNTDWQNAVVAAHNRVGDVLQAQGSPAEALAEYRIGLIISEQQTHANPGNADWQGNLWMSSAYVASMLERSGEPSALDYWQRAYDVLSAMKHAGMYLSPEEEQVYGKLQQKLGR